MPDFCTTSVPGYAWIRAQRQYLARAREAIEMTGPRLHHLSARGRCLAWLQAAFAALRSAWDSCRSITSEDHPHSCSIVDAMPRNPCAVITVRSYPERRSAALMVFSLIGSPFVRSAGNTQEPCPVGGCSSRRMYTTWVARGTMYMTRPFIFVAGMRHSAASRLISLYSARRSSLGHGRVVLWLPRCEGGAEIATRIASVRAVATA